VERVLDLDAVGAALEERRQGWETAGFTVGMLTWRDEAAPWPQELIHDRSKVSDPDSVGVVLRRGADEAEIVVFRGGWADLSWLRASNQAAGVQMTAPPLPHFEAISRMLDELTGALR
jgi:hypothetical protein